MNTLIFYYSKQGNTKQIAEAVAEALQAVGSVRVLNLMEISPPDFEGVDLVIGGTPTYRMNLPLAVKEQLKALPKRSLRGKAVAAFDTSYKMSWFLNLFTASKQLIGKMRGLMGHSIIAPETFLVERLPGPTYKLLPGEVERAKDWGKQICEKLIKKDKKKPAPMIKEEKIEVGEQKTAENQESGKQE